MELSVTKNIAKFKVLKDNKGQTLVEFMLLLGILMFSSLIFLRSMNSGTSAIWEKIANILLEDQSVTIKLR